MKEKFPEATVWACEKTPVFFHLIYDHTLVRKGAKEIKTKSPMS